MSEERIARLEALLRAVPARRAHDLIGLERFPRAGFYTPGDARGAWLREILAWQDGERGAAAGQAPQAKGKR